MDWFRSCLLSRTAAIDSALAAVFVAGTESARGGRDGESARGRRSQLSVLNVIQRFLQHCDDNTGTSMAVPARLDDIDLDKDSIKRSLNDDAPAWDAVVALYGSIVRRWQREWNAHLLQNHASVLKRRAMSSRCRVGGAADEGLFTQQIRGKKGEREREQVIHHRLRIHRRKHTHNKTQIAQRTPRTPHQTDGCKEAANLFEACRKHGMIPCFSAIVTMCNKGGLSLKLVPSMVVCML